MVSRSLLWKVKTVRYFNIFFGFTQHIQVSQKKRFLLKCYTILFSASMLVLGHLYIHIPFFLKYVYIFEYALYVLLALKTKDVYIFAYYEKSLLLDRYFVAKKIYRKLEIYALVYAIGIEILRLLCLIEMWEKNLWVFFDATMLKSYVYIVFQVSCDVQRLTVLLALGLLYGRTLVFRVALESADFKDPFCRFSVKVFLKMYEELIGSYNVLFQSLNAKVCI